MAGLANQPAPLAGTGQRFASAPSSVLRETSRHGKGGPQWTRPAHPGRSVRPADQSWSSSFSEGPLARRGLDRRLGPWRALRSLSGLLSRGGLRTRSPIRRRRLVVDVGRPTRALTAGRRGSGCAGSTGTGIRVGTAVRVGAAARVVTLATQAVHAVDDVLDGALRGIGEALEEPGEHDQVALDPRLIRVG